MDSISVDNRPIADAVEVRDKMQRLFDDLGRPAETVDEQIDQLSQLKDGWYRMHGIKGEMIDERVIQCARRFFEQYALAAQIPAPFIFPTPEGGMRLEWINDSYGRHRLVAELVVVEGKLTAYFDNWYTDEEEKVTLNSNPEIATQTFCQLLIKHFQKASNIQ